MKYLDDIFVMYKDMPTTIKGFTNANSDGTYTVILNSRHSFAQHINSYLHELQHISNNDFETIFNFDELELIRHGGVCYG